MPCRGQRAIGIWIALEAIPTPPQGADSNACHEREADQEHRGFVP